VDADAGLNGKQRIKRLRRRLRMRQVVKKNVAF
jgi:hypothetical protein